MSETEYGPVTFARRRCTDCGYVATDNDDAFTHALNCEERW